MILRGVAHPERIIPDETSPGIIAVHLKRYAFAKPWCDGRRVLDAACGVGYGSAFLAEGAASVVGVDISADTIDYARRRYGLPNLAFVAGDVTALPFDDRSFDAVCSFETIEHVDEPAVAIREAARVVTADGVYVVSTPKADATTRSPANPFHLVELSQADFEQTLRESFREVEVYGQRRLQTRRHRALQRLDVLGLRRRLPGLRAAAKVVGTPRMSELTLDDLVIERSGLEQADDLVAVCRAPR